MFTSHYHYTTDALKLHINNKKMLHFVNIWSKEVPVNVSYPSNVSQVDGYLDASISPILVRYIISINKLIHFKNKIRMRIQGGNIFRVKIKIT